MARFIGYDNDPLPPDTFRLSFGPPKGAARRKPVIAAPAAVPKAPRVLPVPPLPMAARLRSVPCSASETRRAKEALIDPPERRTVRVLREERVPRAQQLQNFPTLLPLLEPPPHPAAATQHRPVVDKMASGLGQWHWAALHALAAGLGLGPISQVLGWLGLPSNAAEFLMTWLGRQAWQLFGGADAMGLYWMMLAPLAWLVTAPRRARLPLLGLGAFYWALVRLGL